MRQTRKITLLKKKVANKKKRNTYKRIKIKKAFRNKKKGGFIKCGVSSTLGRKSVKVLSKELNEIRDIRKNIYALDRTQDAIEILKELKDHYKNNSRTMPCNCSLIKEGDPNNDEKFSTKNDCENAKVEYNRNLKSAFTNVRDFVIGKYYNPQAIGKQTKEEVEKEKDNLQTIIDEIEKKIDDHDEKIEERMPVDEIPEPTFNLSKLAEFQEKLADRTRKNREKNKNTYVKKNKEDERNLKVKDYEKALDKFEDEKPDTKYSEHLKELASLSDVQGDMATIKKIDETKRKTKRKTRRR